MPDCLRGIDSSIMLLEDCIYYSQRLVFSVGSSKFPQEYRATPRERNRGVHFCRASSTALSLISPSSGTGPYCLQSSDGSRAADSVRIWLLIKEVFNSVIVLEFSIIYPVTSSFILKTLNQSLLYIVWACCLSDDAKSDIDNNPSRDHDIVPRIILRSYNLKKVGRRFRRIRATKGALQISPGGLIVSSHFPLLFQERIRLLPPRNEMLLPSRLIIEPR